MNPIIQLLQEGPRARGMSNLLTGGNGEMDALGAAIKAGLQASEADLHKKGKPILNALIALSRQIDKVVDQHKAVRKAAGRGDNAKFLGTLQAGLRAPIYRNILAAEEGLLKALTAGRVQASRDPQIDPQPLLEAIDKQLIAMAEATNTAIDYFNFFVDQAHGMHLYASLSKKAILLPEKEGEDNSYGAGYYPLPANLHHLGMFGDFFKKPIEHKVWPRSGHHMLTYTANTHVSIMTADLQSLISRYGLTRIQVNNPGQISFYFQGPIPEGWEGKS